MRLRFQISTLIPSGLIVGSIVALQNAIIMAARAAARGGVCPLTVAAIETHVPKIVEARILIDQFHAMTRKQISPDIDPWICYRQREPCRVFLERGRQGQGRSLLGIH